MTKVGIELLGQLKKHKKGRVSQCMLLCQLHIPSVKTLGGKLVGGGNGLKHFTLSRSDLTTLPAIN